jgi:tetratricopeptide (TPR) repeat protein
MDHVRARSTAIALALLIPLIEACGGSPPSPVSPPGSSVTAIADAAREIALAEGALAGNQPRVALGPAARAAEICRRRLGAAHPMTWRALELLATVHARMGQRDLAEQLLTEAIALREATLGPWDLSLVAPLDELVLLHANKGRRDREEALRRRALTIRFAALGRHHRDLVVPLVELSALLTRACRLAEAESLLRQAWDIGARTLGASHPAIARVLAEIAELRWQSRDDAGAKQQWARAIAVLEADKAADPGPLVDLLLRLATTESDLAAKKSLGERALAVAEQYAEPGRDMRSTAALVLADTLRAMDDAAGAAALEHRVWAVVRARPARSSYPPVAAASPSAENGALPRCARREASGGAVGNASAVVAGMAAGFRRCYNQGLQQDSKMAGSVRVTARVDRGGEVVWAGATVTSGLSEGIASCVVDRVLEATFAPPDGGGATVVIPVTFVSE